MGPVELGILFVLFQWGTRNNNCDLFKQLSEAYQVLVDDQKRAHYNRQASSSSGRYGYYNHNNNSTWSRNESESRRPPPGYGGGGSSRFFDVALRFVTTRYFLLNVAFARKRRYSSCKMIIVSKSFEETIESVEKIKGKKGTRIIYSSVVEKTDLLVKHFINPIAVQKAGYLEHSFSCPKRMI
ncbi:hypothetical protein IFM89_004516 [Coptis chinensis]|uniref:Uncharacterized protein n=1 Tax=Coptis chinensis TaxID=261450 RepID=A0A835GUN9_9MAGN|nr:hypothetical protein IFM89_004516 [Coptis chinensis]